MATIFYAWQSDTPDVVNRGFIRGAIEKAIDFVNQAVSIDDALDLDQDTQGVPGSPPLVETLLKKINDCTVFIGDLTLVATVDATDSAKRLPNANVLIELGYSLARHGSDRLLGVMNTHFGSPEELPFDLVHRRYPILYSLSPDAGSDERNAVREKLIAAIVTEIRLILREEPSGSRKTLDRVTQLESESSSFVANERLLRAGEQEIFWLNQPQAFLRVVPTKPLAVRSSVQLRGLARNFAPPLRPLATARYDVQLVDARVDDGYVVACLLKQDAGKQRRANCVTKVFSDGQIWGVDQRLLRENEKHGGARVIPSQALRNEFESSLRHYLKFYSESLEGGFPVHMVAGLEFIEGMPLVLNGDRLSEPSIRYRVVHATEIRSADVTADEILRPFYKKLWDACGEVF